MAAPSPTDNAELPAFAIAVNGRPIDAEWQVIAIDIWAGVDRLPRARLAIADGSPENGFPISELKTLIPGGAISIALGYGSRTSQVFAGVIHRQEIEASAAGVARLIVEATDPALAMTLARNSALHEKLTDSTLIANLIKRAGLKATVTSTATKHGAVVQHDASDWDLMLIRAQLNGLVTIVDGGEVRVCPPDTAQTPVMRLVYGESIIEFRAAMDASTQFANIAIKSRAWDPATQKPVSAGARIAAVREAGNLSSEELARVFGVREFAQRTAATLDQASLADWSSAELLRSRLAKIRGSVRFQGSALAAPGCMVELAGLGARFDGDFYVSAVHHHVSDGNWLTDIEIGLAPEWFAAAASGVSAPAAAGQLPPAAGLHTGIVVQLHDDPEGEYRVCVRLPMLLDDNRGVWARLGTLYGSNGVGMQFYPEVGDEVMIAFMNNDPRDAVIVGSVHSRKNRPPQAPDAKNSRKSIVTRSKLRIDFLEDDKVIEITTPAKQFVRLDDKAGEVTIADAGSNRVKLAKSGITLESEANLTVTAKGNIAFSAGGNLTLSAKASVSIDAPRIVADAKMSFTAKGRAEATLSSQGMLTLYGAMVKLS